MTRDAATRRTVIQVLLAVLAGLAFPLATAAGSTEAAAAGASTAASGPSISLTGHGFGHGRGMGQYGALGYAIDQGWTYHQILDHYYGGTTAGTVAASTVMTVDMTTRDGTDTLVAQEQGELTVASVPGVTCTAGQPCAVRIDRLSAGHFEVWQGTGCDGGPGGWKVVAASVAATSVAVTATKPGSDNRTDMLQMCEGDGIRWLRGDIWAVDTGTSQATVNHVPVESYVRGVVPRESPASWGSMNGGAGEQALLAQAVAARSYSMAENRSSYAKTCDTTSCQVYGGRAFQDQAGNYVDLEGTAVYANSDQAVANTAGEVRVFTGGGVARTEFSSSTGGFTTGGTFPAVLDAGDATATNPNHTWTTQVATSTIEAAYGQPAGSFQSLTITGRNGNGDLGGRVTTLVLHFSTGDVNGSGAGFAGAVGLRSDWFAVTAQPGQPPASPTTEADPYHVLTADGTVYAFNGATNRGSFGATAAGTTAVSLGETPGGYQILSTDGSIHPFGAAAGHGSPAGMHLNRPPLQIATTPSGLGYWVVAGDGGVFAYGDAGFHGSTGAIHLNQPVVGMSPTPDGQGYWLVASDGGIFAYGDAAFFGSTGAIKLNKPVIAMAATPDGGGYWLVASDGGIFAFGDAVFAGSLPGLAVKETAVSVAARPGTGYVVATSAGHVYPFGPAGDDRGPGDVGAAASTVAVGIAR